MRFSVGISFLLICFSAFSQDYERVDATIELYPTSFKTPNNFSKLLSRDFTKEDDKVRAIYTWLIKNVAYEPSEYKQFNYQFKNYRERNQKEEKTRGKIIARTLQKGIAVCEGYAMVFEKMCELQGIPNFLVRGDIKTNFNDIGKPFKKVHMWNVATINGNNYLFDTTWGAGKYRDKFIREPSYYYFKTQPNQLIKTHMPHMADDTLLEIPLSKEAFSQLPLLIDRTIQIEDIIEPRLGIISSEIERGVISFRLKFTAITTVSYSFGTEKNNIDFTIEGGTLQFEIPITLGVDHLLIYFDGNPALGYKID